LVDMYLIVMMSMVFVFSLLFVKEVSTLGVYSLSGIYVQAVFVYFFGGDYRLDGWIYELFRWYGVPIPTYSDIIATLFVVASAFAVAY
jgi:hypothetical protein